MPASLSRLVTPAVTRSHWFSRSFMVSPLSISADGICARLRILIWEAAEIKKGMEKKKKSCTDGRIQSSSKGRSKSRQSEGEILAWQGIVKKTGAGSSSRFDRCQRMYKMKREQWRRRDSRWKGKRVKRLDSIFCGWGQSCDISRPLLPDNTRYFPGLTLLHTQLMPATPAGCRMGLWCGIACKEFVLYVPTIPV